MTGYEQNAVDKALRVFHRDFSRLVSDALSQFPITLEPEILLQLQQKSDVFTADYIKSIEIMRLNYGTKPTAALPSFLDITPPP